MRVSQSQTTIAVFFMILGDHCLVCFTFCKCNLQLCSAFNSQIVMSDPGRPIDAPAPGTGLQRFRIPEGGHRNNVPF